MSEYVVNELLSTPDNVEIIRDQICGILALEFAHQYELAQEAGSAVVPDDYDIKVYLENDEPWALQTEEDKSIYPLVHVSLQDSVTEKGSTATNSTSRTATFFIDCYASGSFDGSGLSGRMAVIKAWKTARIARNILEAANYAYLGLRGIVSKRAIPSCETGMPKSQNSAVKLCVVRLRLDVTFTEKSPQVTGVEIDPISLSITDDTGLVVVDMNEEE